MNNAPFRYDIEGLAKEMEIDLRTISTLYNEFFIEMRSNIEECRSFYEEENYDRLEKIIHNIKGISVSLNVNDIYVISNKLDIELKNNKYDNIGYTLNLIKEFFNAAERDIREFFNDREIIV